MSEKNIPIPPGWQVVSKRDRVIKFHKKKYEGSERRFLYEGEVVSFHIFNEASLNNWDFFINDDESCRIWFSQLNGYFFSDKDASIFTCTLELMNSVPISISSLSPRQFWEKVQGKQFKVSVDKSKHRIIMSDTRCKGKDVRDIAAEICKALDEERFSEISSMYESAKCLYTLKEISS